MTDHSLTLPVMRARDHTQNAVSLRPRFLTALLLIPIFLSAVFGLACPLAAVAEPVRTDLTVNTSGGYARLVFRFADDVDANVKLANNILVISFKTPVSAGIDRLNSNAPGYIAAARRDPDGKGVRMAMARKVTVHSMMAGERLFVDLLPDTWTGPPPSLPQEIVEELATRAREAEKKARQQRVLAQQRQMPLSRVRVSHLPTFSRYVFELPELIAISTERGKDRLKLVFEGALKFDLGEAKSDLPPTIEAIDAETGEQQTSVSFAFIGKIDVRSFREDNNYVIDVSPVGGKPNRADAVRLPVPPEPSKKSEAAVHAAVVPVEGLEAPQTVPVRPPTKQAAADAAARATAPTAPPLAKIDRAASEADQPIAKPGSSQPSAQNEPSPLTPNLGGAQAKVEPEGLQHKPEPVTPTPVLSQRVPAVGLSAGAQSAAEVESDRNPPAKPRDPNMPVAVEMRRQADNLRLVFPFAQATAVAVFRRADTLWLVCDSTAELDLAALANDMTHTIQSATVTRSRDGQVVRIKLERPRLTSTTNEGTSWTVTIGDTVLEPTRPLAVNRNVAGVPRASAIIPFDDPHTVHRLSDPEVGDTILAVTAFGPARGFLKPQDFVEFRALASTHGVVIQPIADDLQVEISPEKVVVGRPNGLTMSTGVQVSKRGGNYRPQMFDAQLWGFDREAKFTERQTNLLNAAAAAPETKRSTARFNLARFYFAHDMFAEAKAVLDVALNEERATSEDSSPLVMRAIANVMLGRGDDALKDLSNPVVGNQNDASIWRAFANARQGKWAEAHEGFRNLDATMGTLPIELQRAVLVESIRSAIEVRDFSSASTQVAEFETVGIPKELEPTVALLNGRVSDGLGRNEDALASYRAAAESTDRPSAAQGRLREIVMRYQLGDLKRTDVISDLETLTTIWRGDETEVEALQLLARLYTEDARYRDAFYVMRTAMRSHPNSEMTRRIQEEAATTFDALFLAGKGDAMPAIEALSLFYDFRELTPIGRRGDEMIRRMADRLVSVDLLDQAAELLQHQVDHRLQGAGRAQVATRLAVIYLMNRKPDRALATLRATRTSDLSNELRNQRLLLEGRALSDIGRHEVALEVIANIEGKEAIRLRSDILWAAKRWRESAEQIELLYGERWRDWQPLSDPERSDVLRAAISYTLGDDKLGLDRFRGKYAPKMADSTDRHAFEIVTAPFAASGGEFREVARQVAAVDTLEAFLRDMRTRYPETGSFGPARSDPSSSQTRAPKVDPMPTGATPRQPRAKRTAAG